MRHRRRESLLRALADELGGDVAMHQIDRGRLGDMGESRFSTFCQSYIQIVIHRIIIHFVESVGLNMRAFYVNILQPRYGSKSK